MIAFIEGQLCETGKDHAVIASGGFGYIVQLTAPTIEQLPPAGSAVRLHTFLSVREDGLRLYGFLSKEELELFKLLIQVSGIGPKAAQTLLSSMTADELVMAIASEDARTISRAPGIGMKTAGRVILDLKDKIDLESFVTNGMGGSVPDMDRPGSSANEVITALVSLGYSRSEAARAVGAVEGADAMDSSQLLKMALKQII